MQAIYLPKDKSGWRWIIRECRLDFVERDNEFLLNEFLQRCTKDFS